MIRIGTYGCPYRDIEIIVRTSITFYCSVVGKDLCISQEYDIDCEECSYYLFPEPLCKHYNKKECEKWVKEEFERCPCEIFEKKECD